MHLPGIIKSIQCEVNCLKVLTICVDTYPAAVEAINASHSVQLSLRSAIFAAKQLESYFQRFRKQLSPGNARNVQALHSAAITLSNVFSNFKEDGGDLQNARVMTVNEFLFKAGLDQINMFQLVRHMRETKATFKIAGYYQSQQQNEDYGGKEVEEEKSTTGALHSLLGFLKALTTNDSDGRIIVDIQSSSVRFVLLNAAACFFDIASEAHAVVLASGTLSPLEPVLQLFPEIPLDKMHRFSCGHVVGKERLIAIPLGSGPTGQVLDFRHEARSAHNTMDELGRILINVCNSVCGGVVVFFPSFDYLEQLYAKWKSNGMLESLAKRKKVLREPRNSGEVDAVLQQYGKSIRGNETSEKHRMSSDGSGSTRFHGSEAPSAELDLTGAILFSVVGGKLAEGINFSDELGRVVVMVGLPYPNPRDPELQERLRFIERASGAAGGAKSREHYTNLCMKAVNQCIGRAIRHKTDYAAVLLLDVRYANGFATDGLSGPLSKLPSWIQQSLFQAPSFGRAYKALNDFQKQMQHSSAVEAK